VRKEGSGDQVVDGGMGSGRAVEAMEEWKRWRGEVKGFQEGGDRGGEG